MSRVLLALAALCGASGISVLASIALRQRRSLTARLRPHTPGGTLVRRGLDTDGTVVAFIAVARWTGRSMARVLGSREDLQLRLERIHSVDDPVTFRIRQGGWALGGLALAVVGATIARPPFPLTATLLLLVPVIGFVLPEQLLADRIAARRRRTTLEAPLVAEQLAMLLGAGLSLGAALSRIGDRSGGVIGEDLRRLTRRIRQGVRERDALDEWAATADVPTVRRLVAVLRLHGEASDLGRLVTEEARAAREEAHRALLGLVERKDQQVWIPVTVAALLPGCIFLAVPFAEALRPFTG